MHTKFLVLTGNDIPKSMYGKILDFDEKIFNKANVDFNIDTSMPRETLLSFLNKNITTTSVIYDTDANKVVAYLQAFPLKPDFAEELKSGLKSFKDITSKNVEEYCQNQPLCLYIYSLGVDKKYRGKLMQTSIGHYPSKQKMVNILISEFVNKLKQLVDKNVIIDSVLFEAVSEKGKEFALKANGELFNNPNTNTVMYYSKFDINNFLNINKKSIN